MNDDSRDRMTDEQYDDWLRSIEEAAAEKEEVDLPPQPWGGRQRVQVLISDIQLYQAKNPEILIREILAHYRFDLSAPIKRIPVADQNATMFYGWLKEDGHDDDGPTDELVQAYLIRYGDFLQYRKAKVEGKISCRDLYEMLTRSGMLGTDTFPRSDLGDIDNPAYWSPREDSHHRRSAGKD